MLIRTKLLPLLEKCGQDVLPRFFSKIRRTDTCWEWLGTKSKGYGKFVIAGKNVRAHCLSFAMVNGEPPDGMDLDHLCRNRSCVNPAHLEIVSRRENLLRGNSFIAKKLRVKPTHCKHGHPFDEKNTRFKKTPAGQRRSCRMCHRIRIRQRYWRLKNALKPTA